MKTELVLILDRSGSMRGLEADTIGGCNAMLDKQKKEPGEVRVTTVLFDDRIDVLHDRLDLAAVAPLTEREYDVRGCTALLDAVGFAVQKIANVQKRSAPGQRADKVIFVITTDGYENASREYSYEQVKRMVEEEKEKYGWEFLFLGANIDAVSAAGRFGIAPDRAVNYHADSAGIRLNYEVVSDTVCAVRAGAPVCANWKAEIARDFLCRRPRR